MKGEHKLGFLTGEFLTGKGATLLINYFEQLKTLIMELDFCTWADGFILTFDLKILNSKLLN